MEYAVELSGITPMIQHADSIDWADAMEAWRNDPGNKRDSKAGDDRTPAFRWIGYTYNDGEHLTIPASAISRAMLEAAKSVPTGKRQQTFKAESVSGMGVTSDFLTFLVNGSQVPWAPIWELRNEKDFAKHKAAAAKMGFELLVNRVKVQNSKHIRVRPKFKTWGATFTLSVWSDKITPTVLRQILTIAGLEKGLGVWRPSSPVPGPHGRFTVSKLEKI